MDNSKTNTKRVVIVGGGFAGINAAKQLGNQSGCEVTIVDRRNHHLFQPLLYQVAMAGLDPSDISSPIRTMLNRYRNIVTRLETVTAVDVRKQVVTTETAELGYDYLVVACGATHNYFGNDHWEEFAPGLKTIPQATEIRRRVLIAFEAAERTSDPLEQQRWLRFILVGGGPTGVELAGAIAEMARTTLKRDFKTINASDAKVILIQGGDRVLEQFPDDLSAYGKKALEGLGVEVRLGQRVTDINARGVQVGDEFLESRTIIWAAGVHANPIGKMLSAETDRAGRVIVSADLSIPQHRNVFVAGDLASASDREGNPLPGLAPVAIQQGVFVGKRIAALCSGEASLDDDPSDVGFEYFDKGQMATIGRRRAVMQSGRFKLTGTLAWLGWLFIHIVYLNGFRNRFFVFLSWVWSYVTFARGARLIVPKQWKIHDVET